VPLVADPELGWARQHHLSESFPENFGKVRIIRISLVLTDMK
jgi:hypothetical protein